MAPPILVSVLAGMIFGVALTASAVFPPSVIVGQMHLRDYHMLKVFMIGSGCSALILPVFSALNLAKTSPRLPATIRGLPPYSANLLGGLLIGVGLTLTGACPGTVLAQVATGVPSGLFVLAGGVIGGALWSGFGWNLREPQQVASDTPIRNGSSPPSPASSQELVYVKLNLSMPQAVFSYEILCFLCVALAAAFGPKNDAVPIHPIIGGLLIGIAQACCLLFTGSTLGTSNAYEEAGHWVWYCYDALSGRRPLCTARPPMQSMSFSLGIFAGSLAFSRLAPSQLLMPAGEGAKLEVGKLVAFVGGIVMMFGARLAGGCTSGHGISGMATMGVASFVSVGAMFAGGIGLALVTG